MKIKKLLPLLILILIGCSQQPVEDSILIEEDGLIYLPDSDKPFTGETYFNYPNGKVEYKGIYEEGQLVSESYLDQNGHQKELIDVDHILSKRSIDNIIPKTFYRMEDDEVQKSNTYYTIHNEPYSGPVFKRGKYGNKVIEGKLKNGKWNGYLKTYFNKGSIRTEEIYKDGKWNGPYKYYDDVIRGQLIEEKTYKDGNIDGPYKVYYISTGKLKKETTYKDGNQDGPYKVYYRNGQLGIQGTYKDGYPDGTFKHYFQDGKFKKETTYKDGKLVE